MVILNDNLTKTVCLPSDSIIMKQAHCECTVKNVLYIGIVHGFEKRVLLDINKQSSLGERWEQAET